jgi:hypothetical protein
MEELQNFYSAALFLATVKARNNQAARIGVFVERHCETWPGNEISTLQVFEGFTSYVLRAWKCVPEEFSKIEFAGYTESDELFFNPISEHLLPRKNVVRKKKRKGRRGYHPSGLYEASTFERACLSLATFLG